MVNVFEFRLDQADRGALSEALKVRRAVVTLLVPHDRVRPVKLPAAIARGVRLELRWVDARGQVRPGLVRLREVEVTADESLPTLHVNGTGPRLSVEIVGQLSCESAIVRDVALRVRAGSLHVGDLSVNEQGAAEGVLLDDVLLRDCRGAFSGRVAEGRVRIETATRATLVRDRGDPEVAVSGVVWDSEFEDLRLSAMMGSRLERCHGKIRLISCRNATIQGATKPLHVEAAFEVSTAVAEGAFAGGELKDVVIEPRSIESIALIADQLRVLDPAPKMLHEAIAAVDQDKRLRVAELLHDRMSEKAARQHTVDTAAVSVLGLRRKAARRFGSEWWLLSSYAVLGYGRMIRRPLLLWLIIVVSTLGARFYRAASNTTGFVTDRSGVHVRLSFDAAKVGGDIVLTTVLLPVTWSKSAGTAESRLRIAGGYLTALRLVMIVPLLAIGGAIRRRLRIKPRSETA